MRILVEVPTYDGRIAPCTSESLWRLDKCGHEVDYRPRVGYGVGMARNRIVADALDAGYDRVLMVDNDIELPGDALRNLLDHGCAPLVMGYYLNRYSRAEGRFLTLYKEGPGWRMFAADELAEMREDGITEVKVKGGGLGCALFHPHMFERLPFPWFQWTDLAREPERASSVYDCADSFKSGGEDINFCNLARAAGYDIIADPRVACGHEFRGVMWPE